MEIAFDCWIKKKLKKTKFVNEYGCVECKGISVNGVVDLNVICSSKKKKRAFKCWLILLHHITNSIDANLSSGGQWSPSVEIRTWPRGKAISSNDCYANVTITYISFHIRMYFATVIPFNLLNNTSKAMKQSIFNTDICFRRKKKKISLLGEIWFDLMSSLCVCARSYNLCYAIIT